MTLSRRLILAALLAFTAFTAAAADLTVATARGEARVPFSPKTVLVFDLASLDTLDALGVEARRQRPSRVRPGSAFRAGDSGTRRRHAAFPAGGAACPGHRASRRCLRRHSPGPAVLDLLFARSSRTEVRSAIVLGVIGAGGIGRVFFEAIRDFSYPKTSAMILFIVATLILMDLAFQHLRKRVI